MVRAPDLLDRYFVAPAPNRCWVADFTHISTWPAVVYVAFVVDIFSRRIVDWSAATSKETQLVLDAPDMALWRGFDVVGPCPFDHVRPRRLRARVWVPGCLSEAGGDVVDAGEAEGGDREVSAGRHRPGCVPGPQLGGVLGEGDVSDVVQGLDRPVPADQLGELGGRGLFRGEHVDDPVGPCGGQVVDGPGQGG